MANKQDCQVSSIVVVFLDVYMPRKTWEIDAYRLDTSLLLQRESQEQQPS